MLSKLETTRAIQESVDILGIEVRETVRRAVKGSTATATLFN